MSVEQREYIRLDEKFAVYYDVVPNILQKPIEIPRKKGVAKNISGGGMYLGSSKMRKGVIKKLLNHLNKISLEFCLPDFQNKIRVLAEVRWIKGKLHWWDILSKNWEFGVRFLYIKPEDKDSIIKYVINRQIENHLANK